MKMDRGKAGDLLLKLRKEKGLTQREVAELLNVSDKTVSKWECGLGYPDVSLLGGLSDIFKVNIGQILSGDLEANEKDGGNMRKIRFYVCPDCKNVMTATGKPEISCCGRKLSALKAKAADDAHRPEIEKVENDLYISFHHEMTKGHYISFAAYAAYDRVLLVKLYPEQSSEVRFPNMGGGKLYFYCSRHGFMVYQ